MFVVPEDMQLNKFERVDLPKNSKLFQRLTGQEMSTPVHVDGVADFTSRTVEQAQSAIDRVTQDYIDYANEQAKKQSQPVEPEPVEPKEE